MRNYMLILFLYPVLVFGQGDSITVKVPMGLPTGIAPMGTRFMLLSEPSAIRYLKINASNDVVLRTAAEMLSDIGAQAAGSYQPLATNLTSIGGLANGNGFLKNNGSGTFSYETPAGSGDLLAANNLSDLANAATARTNIGLSTTANLTNSTNKNFVTDAQATVIGNTSGTNTGDQTTVSGNAGTATALQNARTINGTSFNGTANITLGTASVTLAQMADMATASLIYRRTAGTGVPEINTLAQLKTDLTLVKADVGLGNVDNTSNATERAASATLTNKTLTAPVINSPTGIVKVDVGLGNVDNTTDAGKPVSTAQQTALDLKANLASPAFTGTPTGIGLPVYARVTGSNATTTGQSLVTITGLTIALVANATYEVECMLSVSTTAVTTGTGYGINYSAAGATIEGFVQGALTTATDKTLRLNALNTSSQAWLTTSAQTGGILIKAVVTVGANAGNLTAQHLKVTSGTSTVFINSYMRVTRIL